MPSITDLKSTNKKNKIFKKKEYRPWGDKNSDPILENEVVNIEKELNVNSFNSAELEKIWRGLYGAKKIILNIILQNIEETQENILITKAITIKALLSDSSLPINTIKSALQQLKSSNLISNHETKPGKGGFARYQVPKKIYEYFTKKYTSDV
jgi:hypothetical protein